MQIFIVLLVVTFSGVFDFELSRFREDETAPQTGTARELLLELRSNVPQVRAKFDRQGRLDFYRWTSNSNITEKTRRFYVRNLNTPELEEIAEQKKEFDKILSDWKNDLGAQYESMNESPSAAKYEAFLRMDEEFEQKCLESLLPHQAKALQQIHLRFMLRVVGFENFIASKNFRKMSGLSSGQVEKAGRELRSKRKIIGEKILSLKNRVVERLLQSFDEDDAKLILEKWPYLNDDQVLSTEMLRAHLLCCEDNEYFSKLEAKEDIFHKLILFPHFKMKVDGQLVHDDPVPAYQEKHIPKMALGAFLQFKDSEEADMLGLSEWQHENLDAIKLELSKGKPTVRMEGETAVMMENPEKSKDPKELFDDLRKILTVNQWAKFKDVVNIGFSKMQGPAYDILEGPLGGELSLGQDRKKRLQDDFKKAIEHLEKESISIESDAFSCFVDALPTDKAKKVFKDLLGPPLKKSPANLDLLLGHF